MLCTHLLLGHQSAPSLALIYPVLDEVKPRGCCEAGRHVELYSSRGRGSHSASERNGPAGTVRGAGLKLEWAVGFCLPWSGSCCEEKQAGKWTLHILECTKNASYHPLSSRWECHTCLCRGVALSAFLRHYATVVVVPRVSSTSHIWGDIIC